MTRIPVQYAYMRLGLGRSQDEWLTDTIWVDAPQESGQWSELCAWADVVAHDHFRSMGYDDCVYGFLDYVAGVSAFGDGPHDDGTYDFERDGERMALGKKAVRKLADERLEQSWRVYDAVTDFVYAGNDLYSHEMLSDALNALDNAAWRYASWLDDASFAELDDMYRDVVACAERLVEMGAPHSPELIASAVVDIHMDNIGVRGGMRKTSEWYDIDNIIPNGTWNNHANEWWLESPDSIFTLRVSKLGDHVDWWMDRKGSPWLSGDFYTSDDGPLGYDTQTFDMVVRDYESTAWGLDDLVMSDPYRYSKRSMRKRADIVPGLTIDQLRDVNEDAYYDVIEQYIRDNVGWHLEADYGELHDAMDDFAKYLGANNAWDVFDTGRGDSDIFYTGTSPLEHQWSDGIDIVDTVAYEPYDGNGVWAGEDIKEAWNPHLGEINSAMRKLYDDYDKPGKGYESDDYDALFADFFKVVDDALDDVANSLADVARGIEDFAYDDSEEGFAYQDIVDRDLRFTGDGGLVEDGQMIDDETGEVIEYAAPGQMRLFGRGGRKRDVRANAGDKRQYGDVVVRFWRERRDWGDSREIVESPVYVDDYGDLWVDTGSGLVKLDSVCDGGLEVVTDSENRMSGLWNSMTIDRAIERGLDPEEEVVGMRKSSKRNIVALKRKLAQSGENYGWEIESLIRDGDMDFEWDEDADEDDFNEKVIEYAYDYIDSHLIYTDDIMHLLGLYNGTEATKFFWDTCGEDFMDDVLGSIDMHQLWLDLSEENGREAYRRAVRRAARSRGKVATMYQFDDNDVAGWIEDAAQSCIDDYDDDVDVYERATQVAEGYTMYYADQLAIIAYYGNITDAFTGNVSWEDSAAAQFENDIAARADELIEEQGEDEVEAGRKASRKWRTANRIRKSYPSRSKAGRGRGSRRRR